MLLIIVQTGPLALVRQPIEKKENPEYKPVILRLKIDLVSHPPCKQRGWVNTYT